VIITDDQGYGDFSIHGNSQISTPNIDRLGLDSVRFDRFYVNSFCAPTRAALLTGRWPERTGVHGVTFNREAMRPEEVTFAEALKGAGYRTTCIGKWHNGEQYPYTPLGQGFDEFFGFTAGHWNVYFDATLTRGVASEKTSGYITDVLTDEALRFMGTPSKEPFLCYLSYNAPHSPYQVADRYFDKFKAKGLDDTIAAFWGMCENIDDNVGRILAFLDERTLAENTIVLFLTDNGGTAGVKYFNAGMRGSKTSVHEGGSRVPLFVRWPAAGWTPHVVEPIVAHVDLYPTLLDLCGVKPPPGPAIDGRSLRPLLEKEQPSGWPERVLYTHNPIDETNRYPGAVRTQRYRLVREIPGPAGGSNAKARDKEATPWQLYDMQEDPGETTDLAATLPDRVRELSALYETWVDDITRGGLRRFPLPAGYSEQPSVELHAPQAYFSGSLRFNAGPGFANDWLTGWKGLDGKLWFELDVHQAGEFEVEIAFTCPPADAGSRIRVSTTTSSIETTVPAAEFVPVRLPHRDESGKARYQNREWSALKVGVLSLKKGATTLTISPVSIPGSQVMDFKHIRLTRVEAARGKAP